MVNIAMKKKHTSSSTTRANGPIVSNGGLFRDIKGLLIQSAPWGRIESWSASLPSVMT
jgi:hypothetical protein